MLYYDRIDISKGIDPTKSNESKKCMFATITFLIIHSNFKMLSLNIRGIVITTVRNDDYCCIIHSITKSEAVNLLESSA